jgi:hypothetical protein
MHARKDSMDSREFKFIFVGVALVVLLDGAIIPLGEIGCSIHHQRFVD